MTTRKKFFFIIATLELLGFVLCCFLIAPTSFANTNVNMETNVSIDYRTDVRYSYSNNVTNVFINNPEKKGYWKKGLDQLKDTKYQVETGTNALNKFCVTLVRNGTSEEVVAEAAYDVVTGIANAIASCWGLGGISDLFLGGLKGIFFETQTESELQILQQHIDERFDEVLEKLDEITEQIGELSTQVDESTQCILDALKDELNQQYTKELLVNFRSSLGGDNFNYLQFKNYLYGSDKAEKNPNYYTQAYYTRLMREIGRNSNEEDIKAAYDNLYRALQSKTLGDSQLNIFIDYLMPDKISGRESIQKYYYNYLVSKNREQTSDFNIESTALEFALELYKTALFADYCISICNNYQLAELISTYNSADNPLQLSTKYYYGSGDSDYITYEQIVEEQKGIKAREEKLMKQMLEDIAYIFNIENSYTVKNNDGTMQIAINSDDSTYARLMPGQTVYLNKISDYICDLLSLDRNKISFVYSDTKPNSVELIGDSNTGMFSVNGDVGEFSVSLKYEDDILYSINFKDVDDISAFAGGCGTEEDPFLISTPQQFRMIATEEGLKKSYKLLNDIDFSKVTLPLIGTEEKPFEGVFDGNGHVIKNLIVESTDSAGLFVWTGPRAVVKNLHLKTCIFNTNGSGSLYVGGIVGNNCGDILNCHIIDSTINTTQRQKEDNTKGMVYSGGIAGYNSGTILYCGVDNTNISVDSFQDYAKLKDEKNGNFVFVGGITGYTVGDIISCYSDSLTSLSAFAKSVMNSASKRKPYIIVRVGGIVGKADKNGELRDVYSEASIAKCDYDRENKHWAWGSTTKNCSAEKGSIFAEKSSSNLLFEAEKKPVLFGTDTLELSVQKDSNFKDVYECCESVFDTEGLIVTVNGEVISNKDIVFYFTTNNKTTSEMHTLVTGVINTILSTGIRVFKTIEIPISVNQAKPVELIVSELPNRVSYYEGDKIDLTGSKFSILYNNGTLKDVTNLVEYNKESLSAGKKKFEISYGIFTNSFYITVKHDHNYEQTIVPATCSKEGYTSFHCDGCGDWFKTDYIDKLTHTTIIKDSKEATCTQEGNSGDLICTECGEIIELGKPIMKVPHKLEILDKTDYNYGNFHTCSVCHSKLDHEFVGTETEDKYIYTCVGCGYAYTEEKVVAADVPQIIVSNANAISGYTAVVYVEIANNPGIKGADLTLTYDKRLTLISWEQGNVLRYALDSVNLNIFNGQINSPCHFVWATTDADYTSGALLKLIFQIPNDAKQFDRFDIGISYHREKAIVGVGVGNKSEYRNIVTVNGGITVVNHLPGDVNNDNYVNIIDVVLLSRYLAEIKDPIFNEYYSDVDLDGNVYIGDLVALKEYLAGGYGTSLLNKEYLLHFNANGGQCDTQSKYVKWHQNYGELPIPTKTGYVFDGWYTRFIGGQKITQDDVIEYDSNQPNQTLYAHWIINAVEFDGNGATSGSMSDLTYGAENKLPSNEFERKYTVEFNFNYLGSPVKKSDVYYSFIGWAYTENGLVEYQNN